jgi:hypothetical protein
MRTLFLPFLASLVVLFALFVLISEDHTAPSGSGLRVDGERSSDLGEGLMEVLLLRHQRQSDVEASNIAEAQQLLRQNGFYSGPVDGIMNERTREALRSFQESRQLNVTGRIDNDTAQELGLPHRMTQKGSGRLNNST